MERKKTLGLKTVSANENSARMEKETEKGANIK
jgi:hypothetical protein